MRKRKPTLYVWMASCIFSSGAAFAQSPVSTRTYIEVEANDSSWLNSGRIQGQLTNARWTPFLGARWFQAAQFEKSDSSTVSGHVAGGVAWAHPELRLSLGMAKPYSDDGDDNDSFPLVEGTGGKYWATSVAGGTSLFCDVYGEGYSNLSMIDRYNVGGFLRCGPSWSLSAEFNLALHLQQREFIGSSEKFSSRTSKSAIGTRLSRVFGSFQYLFQLQWFHIKSDNRDKVFRYSQRGYAQSPEGLFALEVRL